MGSELVSDSQPHSLGGESNRGFAPISYTEQFYEHLPLYLAIGMTYEQYWDGDCTIVKYYRKAQELKRKQRNQELWLQGLYIYEAICDVSPILHAFAKKGTKPSPYPTEPYPITKEEVEESRKRKDLLRVEKMKAKMAAWAAKTNIKIASNAAKEVKQDG